MTACKLFFVSGMLLLVLPLRAQHQPLISQYMMNKFLFNPALTGLKDQTLVTAGYRRQWTGVEGAPESYYLTAHTPLGRQEGQPHTGIGGTLFRDQAGPLHTSTLSMSAAYHTPLSSRWHLSGGLALGVMQQRLDLASLQAASSGDPALASAGINQMRPFAGAGLWVFSARFFGGVSTIQSPSGDIGSGVGSHVQSRHYFVNSGLLFPLNRRGLAAGEPLFTLIPSFLVRYLPAAPLVYDVNMRLVYKDMLMLGASYRNSGDVVLQLGAEMSPGAGRKNRASKAVYFFSYSYDMGYADFGQMSAGTHEISLGLRLFRDKVRCPLVQTMPMYFF